MARNIASDKPSLNELEKVLTDFRDEMRRESGASNETMAKLRGRLDETERQLVALKEMNKAMSQETLPGFGKKEASDFSLSRCALGMYLELKREPDPWKISGYEKAVLDEMKTRASSANIAGDGSQGGYLIPPEISTEIIDLALARVAVMGLGPTVMSGLRGDVDLASITSRPTSYMLSENEKPTRSESAFGQVSLRPKKMGTFCKVSKRLIYQSAAVADVVIRRLMAESMALKMEEQFISGSGTEKQALGIQNISGLGTAVTVSGRMKLDHIRRALSTLDVANELRPVGNYGVLTRPECYWGLRGERVAQVSGAADADSALLQPQSLLLTDKQIEDSYNVKLGSTTQLGFSSGTLADTVVGDFSQFLIGTWRDFQINVSDQAGDGGTGSAFLQDQVYLLALQEFDSQATRSTAFTKIASCETDEDSW